MKVAKVENSIAIIEIDKIENLEDFENWVDSKQIMCQQMNLLKLAKLINCKVAKLWNYDHGAKSIRSCFICSILHTNVWVKKTETIHSSVISNSSKSIWLIKLSFCQNDSPIGGSFWQKDSLITHILFELWLITLLWIVSVFLTQTLA